MLNQGYESYVAVHTVILFPIAVLMAFNCKEQLSALLNSLCSRFDWLVTRLLLYRECIVLMRQKRVYERRLGKSLDNRLQCATHRYPVLLLYEHMYR
jgi:hypothetical protein